MKRTLLLLLFGYVLFSCKDNKKAVRTEITYMDVSEESIVNIIPSAFYEQNDLFKKVFVSKSIGDSMIYYATKLTSSNKAKFQDELNTRVAIKLIYTDSSNKSIFIGDFGDYTLDTSNTLYTRNDAFINYIQKIINDPIVKW